MMTRVLKGITAKTGGYIVFSLPTEEETEQAYKTITERCYAKLEEKYGGWDLARQRLDEALDYLKKSRTAAHMQFGMYMAELSRQEKTAMYCNHAVSIIDYLLGMSPVDPLPPHYFCINCGHLHTDDSVQDGFDLPPKNCPHCGKPMRRDGHDCSEVVCWHELKLCKRRGYAFNISKCVSEKLQRYLCDKHLTMISSYTYYDCMEFITAENPLLDDVDLDHTCWKEALLCYIINRGTEEAVFDPGDNIKFSDALRAVGLYHSHRTDKSLASFNDSSVIVFRDDPAVETYCFPKSCCVQDLIRWSSRKN